MTRVSVGVSETVLGDLFLFGGFGWLVMVPSGYVEGGRFVIGQSG